MAEATDAQVVPLKPSSADRWSDLRRRLSPLSWKNFIPKDTSSVPNTEQAKLPEEEVENKCFAVLGYLEEYYGSSPQDPTEVAAVNVGQGRGRLKQLEQQVDGILQPSQHIQASSQEDGKAKMHIQEKLSGLLAIPQIRERFEQEFNAELPSFQEARGPMKEARDIDRVAEKVRRAIYKKYLDTKRQQGDLTQSAREEIGALQGNLHQLEQDEKAVEEQASPATLGYLATQKLLDYKDQLKERGFVINPSREAIIDRISREAVAGNKIFLVSSTGTGKTKLGFYVLNSLTGGYELINWQEGTTDRDIFGYRELWTDELGTQSGIKEGPLPRALRREVGVLHDEYTGGSTRAQLAAKFMMGARPGEGVQIPGFNGRVFNVTDNFIEIFTGNPKDERTKQREDMDPAILRELTGIEVGYMSAEEMNDIIRATLIEESGILKLAASEVGYIKKLTEAAELMQRIHNRDFNFAGFTPTMKTLLGIDDQNNTETTLNTNFLDPGTLFKLFGEWQLASARNQSFADYMSVKLGEFVRDPKTLSHPEERRTLQKILNAFGLINSATSHEIRAVIEPEKDEKGYILPSQMAGLALSSENPMAQGVKEGRQEPKTGLEGQEKSEWDEILGVSVDIAPLPDYVTPEIIRNLEALGMEMRFVPNLDLQKTTLDSNSAADYLKQLEALYPNWKPFESLSDDDKKDPQIVRNLRAWYWEQVKAHNVDFPELPGRWMAVEMVEKPAYGSEYPPTEMATRLGLPDNRFNVSWNQLTEAIQTHKDEVVNGTGLDTVNSNKFKLRKLTALEYNLLANREGWGATDTYEHVEDKYSESGGSDRLLVGRSDDGGAANVDWGGPSIPLDGVGWRLAVVFEP